MCPGSYDPVTNGHIDLVERASGLFDEVVVAILHNPAKHGAFTIDERIELIEASIGHLSNVRVAAWADTLVVDVCTEVAASALVKGLRGGTDFAYELPMAHMNHRPRAGCRDAGAARQARLIWARADAPVACDVGSRPSDGDRTINSVQEPWTVPISVLPGCSTPGSWCGDPA